MYTPIIIFAYNRPKHLQRLIDSIRQNPECSHTDLYIFADGARKENDPDVEAVATVVNNITGFASVTPIFRTQNIGLAANIINGVSSIINKYSSVVVLEDDLVASPYLMRYMNLALEYYKDTNAFSIAGYTPTITLPHDYQYNTYAIMRNCSWGWATWRDRWNAVDWDVKNFDKFFADNDAVRKFNIAGNDLSTMLLKQQQGKINSWSIRFCFASFLLQKPTIYPTQSLVSNGGADGSGTNVGNTSRYSTTMMLNDISDWNFCNANDINPQIVESFSKTYNTSQLRKIINYAKRLFWKVTH